MGQEFLPFLRKEFQVRGVKYMRAYVAFRVKFKFLCRTKSLSPIRFFMVTRRYMPCETFQAAVGDEGSLPMSADPDPIKILTTDAEVAGWNSDGLPNDQVHICARFQTNLVACGKLYPKH